MMPNTLSHFAINADDVGRARRFYEGVFGWRCKPFGPPGFFQIETGASGPMGALQQRRQLKADAPTFGFECTIAVADVEATAAEVVAHGGRVIMEKSIIQGVGALMFFEDTEGNVVGAMQYGA